MTNPNTKPAKPGPHDITTGEAYQYGPATLLIVQDSYVDSPWESWEGLPPMAYRNGRDGITTQGEKETDILDPLAHMSDSWLSRNWRKVCEVMEIDSEVLAIDVKDNREYYGGTQEARRALLEETMDGGIRESDLLDVLAGLWNLMGVPAYSGSVRGYCQGDYIETLFVATLEFVEFTGNKKWTREQWEEDHKNSQELFGAWAFGDVFGYKIKDESGDILDSCWGFYGCPWGNNPSGDSWDVLDEMLAAVPHVARAERESALRIVRELTKQRRKMAYELRLAYFRLSPDSAVLSASRDALAGMDKGIKEAKARATAWGALL